MKHWQLELDADRVAFLILDKAGSSANTLASEVLLELDQRARRGRTVPAPRSRGVLGEVEWVRRGRRHQGVHRPAHARAGL